MSIVAVVPVRSLGDGKSRLAGAMNSHLRRFIILAMLRSALAALAEVERITAVAVVSPDPIVLQWVTRCFPRVAPLEQRSAGLNEALDEAVAWVRDQQADAMLVMHPDLPLVTGDAVCGLIGDLDELGDERALVIAPDLAMHGTNAILMRPVGAVPLVFGEDSFARFRAAAYEREVKVVASWPSALSFDLDTSDDFKHLQRLARGRWMALADGHEDARFLQQHFPTSPPEAEG